MKTFILLTFLVILKFALEHLTLPMPCWRIGGPAFAAALPGNACVGVSGSCSFLQFPMPVCTFDGTQAVNAFHTAWVSRVITWLSKFPSSLQTPLEAEAWLCALKAGCLNRFHMEAFFTQKDPESKVIRNQMKSAGF